MYRITKFILAFLLILSSGKGCTYQEYSSVTRFNCYYQMQGRVVPGTPNIRMFVSHCNDYMFDDDKMAKALSIFVHQYSEEFDIPTYRVWSLLHALRIEMSAVPRSVPAAFDINGKALRNVPVSGVALSKDWIWVEVKTKQMWSSALAHELVHIIIWRRNQIHGDPDHEGKEWSGWTKKHTKLIKKFNKRLLELEI